MASCCQLLGDCDYATNHIDYCNAIIQRLQQRDVEDWADKIEISKDSRSQCAKYIRRVFDHLTARKVEGNICARCDGRYSDWAKYHCVIMGYL